MKGFKVVDYISFPFPKLAWRNQIDRLQFGDSQIEGRWTSFLQFRRFSICRGGLQEKTPLRLGKISSTERLMQPLSRRNFRKSQRWR